MISPLESQPKQELNLRSAKKGFCATYLLSLYYLISKNLGPTFQICTFYKMRSCYRHEIKTNSLFACGVQHILPTKAFKILTKWNREEKTLPWTHSSYRNTDCVRGAGGWISTSTAVIPTCKFSKGLREWKKKRSKAFERHIAFKATVMRSAEKLLIRALSFSFQYIL